MDLFDHIKGYGNADVNFTFHDAFSGTLCISHDVSEDVIKRISDELNMWFTIVRVCSTVTVSHIEFVVAVDVKYING